MSLIFFNWAYIGEVNNPDVLVKEIINKRRSGILPEEVNVYYDKILDEVLINTDSGRLRRPLIIVKNGKPMLTKKHISDVQSGKKTFEDLVKDGVIEYLDSDEEENSYIALRPEDVTKEHTHMELNPIIIFGLSSSLIPYGEYDRGDRVNYGAKMIGQSLGFYSSNFLIRTDTKSNILLYPQIPLTSSETFDIFNLDKHPSGQNVVIALLCYSGYNMEDAIIFNKGSIERGFGRSFFFRTYATEESRYGGGQIDEIKIPDKDVRGYRSENAYAHLEEDGIVSVETPVLSGDVLVGKTSPLKFLGRDELLGGIENRRETSTVIRHGEKGVVDKIILSENQSGNKLVKVTVRDLRIPELGDKFASRHGQKGVVGLIIPEEDMPFTEDGIIPDVIMNPHSIPSRLTIGQLLEMLGGKIGALRGKRVNGSMFNGEKEEDLRKQLQKMGFRNDGKEVLYNGITGEKMEVEIYVGMIYYQKLEHMVANKIHTRSRGPVALLTKQPTEGKANEGGLRLGEMEKDCLIAHGAPLLLKERFSSDEVEVPICKNCGLIGYYDWKKNKYFCPICKKSKIEKVNMSYSFKLMLDELKSLLIFPKLKVGEK
ncbi:MAG: DNA-directed RNA polymerase subunit B [Candidatus Aenigmarchaeota archaeon]|nr:DNA-directed RNA polymerase subunit B [Candidatus Aenigmarchaeota archaeon]